MNNEPERMTNMKKMLSMLLALALIFNMGITTFAAEAHTINMSSEKTEASVGDTVYVTVSSDAAIESTGVQVFVYYDESALELDKDKSAVGEANTIFELGNPQTNNKTGKHYVEFSFVNFMKAESVEAGNYYTVAFKALKEGATTVTIGAEVFDADYNQVTSVTEDTVTFNITEVPATEAEGYSISASADQTTTVNNTAAVSVNVIGHSDSSIIGYNDYDVTVSYDKDKLTYESAAAAHDSAVITPDEETGTIRITGHGEAKTFEDAVATLNFTAKASGNADVTIISAKVDNKNSAISNNAPDASVSDDVTVVKVAYAVELPENFDGEDYVLPGEDYTFTAPSEYYDVTVTVGGKEVLPIKDGAEYEILDVDGNIVITAKGMTFEVTFDENNTASVTGADTATHGTDYRFTVEASKEGSKVASVVVTKEDGEEISYQISNGQYIIGGMDITGDFTITVTETNSPVVTFEGVESDEVAGGLKQEATEGEDFTFELNEEDGYLYTVMVGETELIADENGVYTIPANLITEDGVTVIITKLADELLVEVSEYITLDEQKMYLITANNANKVLTYGESTMYWSEQYEAYCWLVVDNDTVDNVKAEALEMINVAEEGTVAAQIAYDFDVNQTTQVDINDAQLTYDMYTGSYNDFTTVTMDKFLEADLNNSKSVNVEDATAVVNNILGIVSENSSQN